MKNKTLTGKKSYIPPLPNPHFEPLIEIISNREINIEGCLGIVEYNDTFVSVNCKVFLINISGFGLCIRSDNKDSILISGEIAGINFSSF